MKIYDIVKYNKFPYEEEEEFMIVADKENHFHFASATSPIRIIKVQPNKDFILLKKYKDGFKSPEEFPYGLQVNKEELIYIRKYIE